MCFYFYFFPTTCLNNSRVKMCSSAEILNCGSEQVLFSLMHLAFVTPSTSTLQDLFPTEALFPPIQPERFSNEKDGSSGIATTVRVSLLPSHMSTSPSWALFPSRNVQTLRSALAFAHQRIRQQESELHQLRRGKPRNLLDGNRN